jgi:hypothetical protein
LLFLATPYHLLAVFAPLSVYAIVCPWKFTGVKVQKCLNCNESLYFGPSAFPYTYIFISPFHKEPSLAPSRFLVRPMHTDEGRNGVGNVFTIAQILSWNVKEVSQRHAWKVSGRIIHLDHMYNAASDTAHRHWPTLCQFFPQAVGEVLASSSLVQ